MASWWQRLVGRRSGAPTVPVEERVSEESVVGYAEQVIWPGFCTQAYAVETVADHFAGSAGAPDAGRIAALVDQVWQQRADALTAHQDAGDWGRLAAAFAELERSGWVARMDFTCCQTCGHAEIGDERTGAEHSYVFFHWQDTERLAGPAPHLGLCYSYFDTHPGLDRDLAAAAQDSEDERLQSRAWDQHARIETAVGATLVECLRRHDLRVSWDGSHETRPGVALRDWRKPLPTAP